MNHTTFKVSTGLAYRLCEAHCKMQAIAHQQADAMAKKYHATPGRWLTCGTDIEGLHFGPVVPTGWRKSKACPGYCVPGTSKLGKAIKAELDTIEVPSAEKLARDLGCKPFFMDLDDGGQYCASIGIFQHAGTFYLETSRWCPPSREKFPDIIDIPASEWHKADEDRIAANKAKP